jgi:hypothetical protein
VPVPFRNDFERRVEAVGVVGGRAGVTTQKFTPVFTNATKLHVIVVLLLGNAFSFL